MYYLEKAFDLLARRSDTVFLTSSEIADWFVAVDPNGLASSTLPCGRGRRIEMRATAPQSKLTPVALIGPLHLLISAVRNRVR